MVAFSLNFYMFLNALEADGDGKVIVNQLDTTPSYISKQYTPNLQVSVATSNLLTNLNVENTVDMNASLSEDSLTYLIITSDLKTTAPDIYQLAQAVIADTYTYYYAIQSSVKYLNQISPDDVSNTIGNITYLIDYFSGNIVYDDITMKLTDLQTSLGILKNQLLLIKQEASK